VVRASAVVEPVASTRLVEHVADEAGAAAVIFETTAETDSKIR